MASCGMGIVKYLLFAFNIIFCITGVLLIVLGSVVLYGLKYQASIDEIQSIQISSIILIVVGVIVFVIAFLGCFGAIRESYALLMTFAVFLLIIFIIELAIGIAVAVNKEQIKRETIRSIFDNQDDDHKANFEMIQSTFQCCGVDGVNDWNNQVPKSCCTSELIDDISIKDELQNCKALSPSTEYLYKRGCYDVLQMAYTGGKSILIGVGIGIALVELIGIVLACWLAAVIKREKSDYE